MNRGALLLILLGVGAFLYSRGAFASMAPSGSMINAAPPLPLPDETGTISDPVYNPPIPSIPAY